MKRKNTLDVSIANSSSEATRKKRSRTTSKADATTKAETAVADDGVMAKLELSMLSILNSRKPGASC